MNVNIEESWKNILKNEFEKSYFKELTTFIRNEYKTKTIYPSGKMIFSAFDKTPFSNIKVVILGQDPYHGPNQAHGLCFSVMDGVKFPPSLNNIFKEIQSDLGKQTPMSGNLEYWAKQGILLLNATLTVEAGKAGSHQKKGWEQFTDAVIQSISDQKENVVFLLWGSYAQKKGAIIDAKKHHILKTVHPSPLSAHRGFFGCKHFSKTNNFLKSIGEKEINW